MTPPAIGCLARAVARSALVVSDLLEASQAADEAVLEQVDGLVHGRGSEVRAHRGAIDVEHRLDDGRALAGRVGCLEQLDVGVQHRRVDA